MKNREKPKELILIKYFSTILIRVRTKKSTSKEYSCDCKLSCKFRFEKLKILKLNVKMNQCEFGTPMIDKTLTLSTVKFRQNLF